MTLRRIPHPRNHGEPLTLAWIESNCEKVAPPHDALSQCVEGDCWVWLGAVNSEGYGFISHEGQTVAAHRLSYMLLHGTLPRHHGDHLCRNRQCANPSHIEDVPLHVNIHRGLRTRHLLAEQCADCGSTEGKIKPTRNGQQWVCTPCLAVSSKALFAKKYATPQGKAEIRARNKAKKIEKSTVNWRAYLTDEERALFV